MIVYTMSFSYNTKCTPFFSFFFVWCSESILPSTTSHGGGIVIAESCESVFQPFHLNFLHKFWELLHHSFSHFEAWYKWRLSTLRWWNLTEKYHLFRKFFYLFIQLNIVKTTFFYSQSWEGALLSNDGGWDGDTGKYSEEM